MERFPPAKKCAPDKNQGACWWSSTRPQFRSKLLVCMHTKYNRHLPFHWRCIPVGNLWYHKFIYILHIAVPVARPKHETYKPEIWMFSLCFRHDFTHGKLSSNSFPKDGSKENQVMPHKNSETCCLFCRVWKFEQQTQLIILATWNPR